VPDSAGSTRSGTGDHADTNGSTSAATSATSQTRWRAPADWRDMTAVTPSATASTQVSLSSTIRPDTVAADSASGKSREVMPVSFRSVAIRSDGAPDLRAQPVRSVSPTLASDSRSSAVTASSVEPEKYVRTTCASTSSRVLSVGSAGKYT
jgi:hypothetical protein